MDKRRVEERVKQMALEVAAHDILSNKHEKVVGEMRELERTN